MEVWKIIFLSKWVICRFHVNLPGCKIPGIRMLGATSKAPGCNRKHHGVWSIFLVEEAQPKPSFVTVTGPNLNPSFVTGILGGGLTKGSMKSLRRLDMFFFGSQLGDNLQVWFHHALSFPGVGWLFFSAPLLFEINKGWNEKSDMKDLYKQVFYFCHFRVHQNNFHHNNEALEHATFDTGNVRLLRFGRNSDLNQAKIQGPL